MVVEGRRRAPVAGLHDIVDRRPFREGVRNGNRSRRSRRRGDARAPEALIDESRKVTHVDLIEGGMGQREDMIVSDVQRVAQ